MLATDKGSVKLQLRGTANAFMLRDYECACCSVDGERHCQEAEGRGEEDGH